MELPYYIEEALEIFGLEQSDIKQEGEDLLVECDNFDHVYSLRNKLLDAQSHTVILHPSKETEGFITLRIESVLSQSPQP